MPTSDPAVPAFPPGGMRMSEAPVPAGAPDDPNVTIIRDFIGALDGGDRDRARQLLGEKVSWVMPGRSVVAGVHTGPEAALEVDATMRRLSDGTLRHQALIWLAAGPHAHAVVHQAATRDGVEAGFDRAFVFTIADGLIVDVHAYTDDLYAFDDFWH
jgi:ketosteroid isomerase-like protein